MKIILINYHYFIHGGPDRYFFNVKAALEREGHTIVPFAFDYDDTLDTPYRNYFPDPITGKGPCLLSQLSLTVKAKVKAVCRMFLNREVDSKFRALMDDEKPDVVFTIYLASSLLPNILKIAKKEYGVPVIYRLSDFHFFCASHTFYRDGNVCTDCMINKCAAIKYKCIHDSYLASIVRVFQMKYFQYKKWYHWIDWFICPSEIMVKYLVKGGISPGKICHIPTFATDVSNYIPYKKKTEPYALYFGRVNQQKGLEILIKAFNSIEKPNFKLKIVGYVEPKYKRLLIDILDQDHGDLLSMLPPQKGGALLDLVHNCSFVVHPAIWLENLPNSVLEAMSAAKPIIASNLGSLPEMVKDGVNGKLFEAGNPDALAAAIQAMVSSPDQIERMGIASRQIYEKRYSEGVHTLALLDILTKCMASRSAYHTGEDRVSL